MYYTSDFDVDFAKFKIYLDNQTGELFATEIGDVKLVPNNEIAGHFLLKNDRGKLCIKSPLCTFSSEQIEEVEVKYIGR